MATTRQTIYLCIIYILLLTGANMYLLMYTEPASSPPESYCTLSRRSVKIHRTHYGMLLAYAGGLAFAEDDYPEFWDLPPAASVALVVEDPVHYAVVGPDAREEWASSTPEGVSYLHLGPERRAFSTSMFHQQHCLRAMRAALAGDYRPYMQQHFTHCLHYIRQMILCAPNLTLEPADVLERDYDAGMKEVGAIHMCQDWRQVYEEMEANWRSDGKV
ncbi:hypothetical protein C8Q80DRAFT_1179059 [Daedaleopsis nitida]|nr:hypothetical protein C8Q80DRAFT_1179059 [Daedaleopsis nitida]